MSKNARSQNFKSPMCRLSYANGLFKATALESGKAPSFRCTLIFENKDRAELEKYVAQVITERWGDAGIKKAKAGVIRSPFLAGDGKEARNKESGEINPGLGEGLFFIRVQAGEDRPPFAIWKDPNKQETEENVYSGCYGKAVLQAFTWTNAQGGEGVSFGIEGFQKLKEGERLGGGRADPTKYYETVEDMGDAPSETRTGGGAGSLFGD